MPAYIYIDYVRSRLQSLGFSSLMRTRPQLQRFKRTFGFLGFFVVGSGFVVRVALHVMRSLDGGQLKGETPTRTRQQLGHAIHAFLGAQRARFQGILCRTVVGAAFGHGTLEFLGKAGWQRETT